MRSSLSILSVLAIAILLAGCRCWRHTASSSTRTEAGTIDVRSRSLHGLRDTLAERQTIRIHYYPAYTNVFHDTAIMEALTDTVASVSRLPSPSGKGGLGSVSSIEIVTERNVGKSLLAASDSSFLSQASAMEAAQEEAASEARQDNGTLIGIAVVAAVAVFCYLSWKEVTR